MPDMQLGMPLSIPRLRFRPPLTGGARSITHRRGRPVCCPPPSAGGAPQPLLLPAPEGPHPVGRQALLRLLQRAPQRDVRGGAPRGEPERQERQGHTRRRKMVGPCSRAGQGRGLDGGRRAAGGWAGVPGMRRRNSHRPYQRHGASAGCFGTWCVTGCRGRGGAARLV